MDKITDNGQFFAYFVSEDGRKSLPFFSSDGWRHVSLKSGAQDPGIINSKRGVSKSDRVKFRGSSQAQINERMDTIMKSDAFIQNKLQQSVEKFMAERYIAEYSGIVKEASNFNSESQKWKTASITEHGLDPECDSPMDLYRTLANKACISKNHNSDLWFVVLVAPNKGKLVYTAFFVPPLSNDGNVYPSGRLLSPNSNIDVFSEGMWWYNSVGDAKAAAMGSYLDSVFPFQTKFTDTTESCKQLLHSGTNMLMLGNVGRSAIITRLYFANYFLDNSTWVTLQLAEDYFSHLGVSFYSWHKNTIYYDSDE